MTIRIRKLSEWQRLPFGQVLEPLIDTVARKWTLEVNTTAPTRFGWVAAAELEKDPEKEEQRDILLGVVHGLDTIEFRPTGPGVITVQGEGEVWYQTDDGQTTIANNGAEFVPYTRLLEPKDRNQQLEEIIIRQQAAHNRRMKQQEGERIARDARIAALEAELAKQEAERGEDAGGVVAGATEEASANGSAGSAGDVKPAKEGGGLSAAK